MGGDRDWEYLTGRRREVVGGIVVMRYGENAIEL